MNDEFNKDDIEKIREIIEYHIELKRMGKFLRIIFYICVFLRWVDGILQWIQDNRVRVIRWLIISSMPFAALEWSEVTAKIKTLVGLLP